MTQGLALTLLSLLLYGSWGFSYKLLSARDIHGEWIVALVMLVGAVISAAIALTKADPLPISKIGGSFHILLLAALSGAVGNIFLVKAMASPGMSSGVALAISGAYPMVAALLGYLFLNEQLTGLQITGTAAIVFGVGLLMVK